MHFALRTRRLGAALLLPASVLAAAPVLAQSGPAPASASSVTVTGKRSGVDTALVTAAKSKVLSRQRASSCNYMSAYSAAEDDITQAYMSDFGMQDSASNEAERFRVNSPNGDASNIEPTNAPDSDLPLPLASNCGRADRNFAAARHRIALKDKTLAEAFVAFDARDFAKARQLATTAHRKVGYHEAAIMLANLHLYGLGTPQSTPQAVQWLRQVVDSRLEAQQDTVRFNPAAPEVTSERVEAMLTLAKIALRGIGAPKNPADAAKWYGEAAKLGFMPANNTLGMAHLNGFGVPQDARRALAYFKEAAEAGYAPAQYNLAKLYYNGDDGVAQDLKLAGAWFEAGAKAGHAGSLFAVGRIYDQGQGVAADQNKAIVYYKEAALKSDPEAQGALATYFYTGEVVAQDLPTARKLFASAAKQGQADAMFNLGVMSVKGEGGAKDLASAYVWFTLARDSGHASAAVALKSISGKLSAAEMAKADSVLKPKS